MSKIKIIDQSGKEKSETDLNPRIFEVKVNPKLMAQAVRVRLTNARLGTRKTKTRGEVRGGGKKPWRQKGTGRARHGSIRSPIWVGGGHAHALAPFNYLLNLPKKQRRAALFSALSLKQKEGKIFVLEAIDLKEIKTQAFKKILDNLKIGDKTLVVIPKKDEIIETSARNLPRVKALEARLLNAYDVLKYENVLMLKDSLGVIEKTFLKSRINPNLP